MRKRSPDEAKARARADAYRAGLCVECKTEPHSAGRPRCEGCHRTYAMNGGQFA